MTGAITHVVGQFSYCRKCGFMTEVYETQQGSGPYCRRCVDAAADEEEGAPVAALLAEGSVH